MINRIKNKKNTRERQFNFFKLALFYLCIILSSPNVFTQDSIPEKEDLTEEAELKFQQFFFKAISEKSIGNYQKAIENLENCNQLLSNDVAVFFEFSKNYLLLKNTLLAKEYINRALEKDADNIWMLKHLVKVCKQENNLTDAILTQEQIVKNHPKEREVLVGLYLYNRQYEEAIALMNILEKENALSSRYKKLKANLNNRKESQVNSKQKTDVVSLIDQYNNNKSYKILEQIIKTVKENPTEVLKYSEEGITLFPAQPFVYLSKAKVLNYQKNYKNALTTLNNGIDFVINEEMEVLFYNEMAKAYRGLGNVDKENKYKQKANKLKSN